METLGRSRTSPSLNGLPVRRVLGNSKGLESARRAGAITPRPLRVFPNVGLAHSYYSSYYHPYQEEAAEACSTSCSHAVSFSGPNPNSPPPNSKSSTSESNCKAPCWLVKLPLLANCCCPKQALLLLPPIEKSFSSSMSQLSFSTSPRPNDTSPSLSKPKKSSSSSKPKKSSSSSWLLPRKTNKPSPSLLDL